MFTIILIKPDWNKPLFNKAKVCNHNSIIKTIVYYTNISLKSKGVQYAIMQEYTLK